MTRLTQSLLFCAIILLSLLSWGQTFSFDRTDYFTGQAYPAKAMIADFNGDGKNDLAIIHRFSNIVVFLGQGDGSLGTRLETSFSAGEANGMAAADFNGDGKLDLAVTSFLYPNGALTVLWGGRRWHLPYKFGALVPLPTGIHGRVGRS